MSLLNTIAAVPEDHICALRRDPKHEIVASTIGRLSSFGIGGWSDPLGLLLNEVMLGGVVIDPGLVHDRDVPRYHDVDRVQSLSRRIEEAWRKPIQAPANDDSMDDWVRSELGRARDVVGVASARGECLYTAWEVIGGVRGTRPRIRELRPREAMLRAPGVLPPPLVVAGCIAGGILAAALWRQRRLRRMRLPKP